MQFCTKNKNGRGFGRKIRRSSRSLYNPGTRLPPNSYGYFFQTFKLSLRIFSLPAASFL